MKITALLSALNSALAEPFALAWSQDSPRFLLVFTVVYAVAVAELEEQSKSGTPISLLELAQAVQHEDEEKRRAQQPPRRETSDKKPSILAKLKAQPTVDTTSLKSAPKRSAEREL